MRFLLSVLLIFAAQFAYADTVSEICAGAPNNAYLTGCPEDPAGSVLGVPTQTGVDITGLPAAGVWYLRTYKTDNGVCSGFTDATRYDLLNEVAASSNGREITGSTVTVDWLTSGETGNCIDIVDYSRLVAGPVETLGPFDTDLGAAIPISWNPGAYMNIRDHILLGSNRLEEHDLGNIEPRLVSSPLCTGPYEAEQKGITLRLHWRFLELLPGDYSNGFAILDEVFRVLRSECGTTPKRVQLITDFKALNQFANRNYCVPEDLEFEMVAWENNGGRRRCAGPIYRAGTQSQIRYRAMFLAYIERYKDEPLLEYISPKGEGAFGLPNNVDNTFDYTLLLNELVNIGLQSRAVAPKKMVALGINNFRAGELPNEIETIFQPVMQANAGFGLRWPDTFCSRAPNPNLTQLPIVSHHQYLAAFAGNVGMMGELQLMGPNENRCDTYEQIWQEAVNPAGFFDPAANVQSAPGPHIENHFLFGTTNMSHFQTHTTGVLSMPEPATYEAFLQTWDSHGWQQYSTACPAWWTANGATCLTGEI